MNYITYKRFKSKAICGDVNIPATTEVQEQDGIIYYQDQPICFTTSQNAHDYFTQNEDGKGMERGQLIQTIIKKLSKDMDDDNTIVTYQDKWDRIWDDENCQKYKRSDHADYWLWNNDFYNAPIEDLEYILDLIGG